MFTTNVKKFWNSRCEEEHGSQNGITKVLMSPEGPGIRTSFEMESTDSQVMTFSPIVLRKRETQNRHEMVELILFWRLAIKWLQKEDPV